MNADEQPEEQPEYQEKLIHAPSGFGMLFLAIGILVVGALCVLAGVIGSAMDQPALLGLFAFVPICLIAACIICSGLIAVQPNRAVFLQFCGKYVGTIKNTGYIYVNPFYAKTQMSLKA